MHGVGGEQGGGQGAQQAHGVVVRVINVRPGAEVVGLGVDEVVVLQ